MAQEGLRVLVCGGRDYADRQAVFRTLDALSEADDDNPLGKVRLIVIHGACPTGADRFADEWAVVNWATWLSFPADWSQGRKAGPIRNQRMIDEGKPDLVVAFPGGRGTADMVRRARKAGVEVREIACTDRLRHRRVRFADASAFVNQHHRHHKAPQGHVFSIGAYRGDHLVGVVIVGRPVARRLDDGLTAEVTRLCVLPDEPKVVDRRGKEHAPAVCSFLYAKARTAAAALGFVRFLTYTLARESGSSLDGAGMVYVADTPGKSWNVPTRPREDSHELGPKVRWEGAL